MADEQPTNGGAPVQDAPLSAEAVKAQERAEAAAKAQQPWYASLPDEEARGVAELHKWATPVDAIKSYRELEKLRGVPADRLLTIPEKSSTDDPEAWGKFYDRLGRPGKPEGYELKPAEWSDQGFVDKASTVFHQVGITKTQAAAIMTALDEEQRAAIEASDRNVAQQSEVDLRDLQREWGGQYNEREELAKRAVRTFVTPLGMGEDDLNLMEEAIGTAKLIKLFAGIGERLGEARPVEGNPNGTVGSFGLSPEGARMRIQQLMGDREWGGRVIRNPDGPEAQELDRLQRISVSGGR